jgi:aminotransferase
MTVSIAQRISTLQQSDIRAMTRVCEQHGGINLGQGLGDLLAPLPVRDAARNAIDIGANTYAPAEGISELREAIAAKLARDNHISADAEHEIVVTCGATAALASTLQALLNVGDGILLCEPFYGYHLNTIVISGIEPHFVELPLPSLILTEAALRAAMRPNTRALLLCSPANPSGHVLSLEEIEAVERVATEFDLLVITDEIYEYITYDGRQHISPASVGSLRERTVTISGFSKTFSITGWRIGFAVAPPVLAAAIATVHDLYYICAPAPLQHGAAAGLQHATGYLKKLRHEYQWRRDLICDALDAARLPPLVPQGAYYVLADVSRLDYADARKAALGLLQRSGVAAVPGSAFFASATGERYLRFCFAKEETALREAASRLRKLHA